MQLNIPTLVLVDIYILALVGILMLHAWRRGRREPTLGYLSAMLLLGALATVLGSLRGIGMDFVPLVIGNVALQLCGAMNWTAMRVFAGRQPHAISEPSTRLVRWSRKCTSKPCATPKSIATSS